MPTLNIPKIVPNIETSIKSSINLLLASIAFEELGLAQIIKAEADKIQLVLGSFDENNRNELPSLAELLKINRSVEQVMRKVINKEMLLAFQLEDVIDMAKESSIMPESIELDYEHVEIYMDETHLLTASVLPHNSTHKEVTWTSSDTSIAQVSDIGLVTPAMPGCTKITAKTVNNLTASCEVTVNPLSPKSITLDYEKIRLAPDNSQQLTATVLPIDAGDKSVTWTSGNVSVATVSGSGLVTAIAPGTPGEDTKITAATVNGHTAECIVIVLTILSLFEELEEKLQFGYYVSGDIKTGNAYNKLANTTSNAKDQYEKGHYDNAIKQLQSSIEFLHDESGNDVNVDFAYETILIIEGIIDQLLKQT